MEEFDNYKLIEKIDSGGMATVFKGVQLSLGRKVAIKVLHKKLSDQTQIVERFNRESLIIARLAHPNIIHIIDRGITKSGMPFFVMEFIEGSDILKVIKAGTHSIQYKLDIVIQVCKALAYAHKNGVIHRDIKPANILLDSENNVMVADFGIAQLFDRNTRGDQLTRDGTVLGTLSYMSPEQKLNSRCLTEASDIYSLGVVMYELLTGEKPLGRFKAPTDLNPEIPVSLEAVILKCLEPEPSDRFATADELKDQLLGILQGAHIGDTKKQQVILGIPKMEERFALIDIIKEHEFGAVYLFRHRTNGQLMVVKKFEKPLGGLKEAQLLTTLKHKHIVDIFGASGTAELYIIVMEYVSGGNLEDRLIRPHDWPDTLTTIKQICEGLSFAHRNRIIHGNLRPSNIMLTANGEVRITDFGLNEHYTSNNDKDNWYNPFQQKKSYLTDLYAVGVICYKMLTGVLPSSNGNGIEANEQFQTCPREIQRFVNRMLSKQSNKVFRNTTEVLAVIDELLILPQPIAPAKIPEIPKHTLPKPTRSLPTIAPPPPQPTVLGRAFLLLMLLMVLAIAYLIVSGNVTYFTDAFSEFWHDCIMPLNKAKRY